MAKDTQTIAAVLIPNKTRIQDTDGFTGGSFLRLNKIDLGVELSLKLIQSRYVDPDAPLVAPNNILPYSARTSSGRNKPIEFLGEMKVRKRQQLEDLDDISLRSMGISKCANGDERELLTNTFQHLKELDLAGNLFSDWNDLFEVLLTFPQVEWLSFASNKIHDIPLHLETKQGGFGHLRVLNLNKCSIESFRTIEILDKICPNIEELCIAFSDLSDMSERDPDDLSSMVTPLNGFRQLQLLDCSSCNLDSWADQVHRLAHLPKLKTLILDDNLLSDPVLNASQISAKERLEAERRYVSSVSREILQIKNQTHFSNKDGNELSAIDAFNKLGLNERYPRFEELVVKHKESMIVGQSSFVGEGSISNNALNVTIVSMAAESCTSEPLVKRLPASLKIGRLKTMCARAFGLDVELQILHFRSEGDDFPNPMDDDENTLAYYGVNNGAEILMNEVDIKAQRDEDAKKKKMRNREFDEQEKRSNAIHAIRKKDVRAQVAGAESASNRLGN
eukprot:scaffold720_cov157-Chaetoceros_neogracile.AAC.3